MPYVAGPFDSPHIYVQWGGKLPGNEQWSCGLRMYSTGGGADAEASAASLLDDIAPVVQAYHVASMCSGRALLSYVKVNAIGTDGHYIAQTTNEHVVADVGGSGNPSTTPANQVALVVSLTTGFSRGPAHRGRYYMPLPAVLPDTDGRISATIAGIWDAEAETFIANLNATNATWKVGVFSRKLGSPGHRAVTGAQVGRVLDTQRRRRRSLVEAYTA